jgi:hypothetical protein
MEKRKSLTLPGLELRSPGNPLIPTTLSRLPLLEGLSTRLSCLVERHGLNISTQGTTEYMGPADGLEADTHLDTQERLGVLLFHIPLFSVSWTSRGVT